MGWRKVYFCEHCKKMFLRQKSLDDVCRKCGNGNASHYRAKVARRKWFGWEFKD